MLAIFLFTLTSFTSPGSSDARVVATANAFFQNVAKRDLDDGIIWQPGSVQRSHSGIHLYYSRAWKGIPVVDTRPQYIRFGHQMEVLDHLAAPVLKGPFVFPIDKYRTQEQVLAQLEQREGQAFQAVSAQAVLITSAAGTVPCWRIVVEGERSPHSRIQLDVDSRSGRILREFSLALQAEEGSGRIFRHNPIAGNICPTEQPESSFVNVPLPGLDGSGYLRGEYVDVTFPGYPEFDPRYAVRSTRHPSYQPGLAQEADLTYDYSPDDPRFEEVMTYFWIDLAQRQLQDLGFAIFDRPIRVDCHSDPYTNASFLPAWKAIIFGDGYVDSAEDAEVILHEYGHAILDDVAGERFYNSFGSMFHEGFADFFSYLMSTRSESLVGSNLYPGLISEWFGSFLPGSPSYTRSLDPPAYTYPVLLNEAHQDGKLWSSLFFQLAGQIGLETTATLLLESLYYMDNAHPESIAASLFQADDLLFDGAHQTQLEDLLRARGFLDAENSPQILRLVPGQTVVLPRREETQLLRFTVPETAEHISLRIEPDSFGYHVYTLNPAAITTYEDIQKARANYFREAVVWNLDKVGGSGPDLIPGSDYFVTISSSKSTTLTLEILEEQANPIALVGENEVVNLLYSEFQPAFFELSDLGSRRRLFVHYNTEDGQPLLDLLAVSRHQPFSLDDLLPEDIVFFDYQETDPIILDLPDSYQAGDRVFVSLIGSYAETAISLRWTAVEKPNNRNLSEGRTVNGRIVDDNPSIWDFALEPGRDSLIFETDATHPFTIATPFGFLLQSALYEGKHTLICQSDAAFLVPLNFRLGPAQFPGKYRVYVKGQTGSAYSLRLRADETITLPLLAPETPIEKTLGVGEITGWFVDLPVDGYGMSLTFEPPEEGAFRFIFLGEKGEYIPTIDFTGVVASKRFPNWRQDDSRVPLPEQGLVPGSRYQLWVYNNHTQPLQLAYKFQVHSGTPPEPTVLGEDQIIELSMADTDNLWRNSDYYFPYRVNPPPGTRRIRFSFEHLGGNKHHGLAFRQQNGSFNGRTLHDIRLGEFQMLDPPDQPLTLHFSGTIWSRSDDAPGRYRVQVHYETDPYDGHLTPDSPALQDGLVSRVDRYTHLEVPEHTRAIDIGLLHQDRLPLTLLKVSPGALPSYDLAPFQRRLSGELNFRDTLDWSNPNIGMQSGDWIINLFLATNFTYNVGYDDSSPIPYELKVRYRPMTTEFQHTIPLQVMEHPVQQGSVRLINPLDQPLELEDGSSSIPAGGFLDQSGAGQTINPVADSQAILFETLSGLDWSTLATLSPYRHDKLTAMHIPPDASVWQTALLLQHDGSAPAALTINDVTSPLPNDGAAWLPLSNPDIIAGWGLLETAVTEDEAFAEIALHASQYWSNGPQVTAASPFSKAANLLYVPHLSQPGDWWTGLSLANTGTKTTAVTVVPFLDDGTRFPSSTFSMEPGVTRVDLVEAFLPEDAPRERVAWLRIQAEGEPITGLQFFGAWSGSDGACLAMPAYSGRTLILPGSTTTGWNGLAVTNTVNRNGIVRIQALGPDGHELASTERELPAYRKILVIAETTFPGLAPGSYSLRVDSEDLLLVAVQLSGDASRLASVAAEAVR